MKADFQIIGGGLIGLSTAYALLERGAGSVRVLEARDGVALETSYANAGMVHASLADPWNGPGVGQQLLGSLFDPSSPMKLHLSALPHLMGWGLKFLKHSSPSRHWQATQNNYRLAVYSMQKIENWRDKLKIEDGFEGMGMMKIFRSQQGFNKAKPLADKMIGLGLEAHYLTGKQAAQREPCLAPIAHKIKTALYFPNDYRADAYKFCRALEVEIIRLGGTVETGVHVEKFIKDGPAISGVNTNKGAYFAGTTVVAAGARSYQLLKPLGVKLSMRPVKGYSLTFKDLKGPKMPVGDMGLHAAVTPLGDDLRIAGTAEITGFNPSMKPARLEPLLAMLREIYPDLTKGLSMEDGQAWHGFRPVSADGSPFIDSAHPGLAINTGHAHMGWTFSAGSGALLADLLLGNTPKIDAEPFALSR